VAEGKHSNLPMLSLYLDEKEKGVKQPYIFNHGQLQMPFPHQGHQACQSSPQQYESKCNCEHQEG
jgi:hypothetical protein